MIHAGELRIGNRVFWKPKILQSNTNTQLVQVEVTAIFQDKISYISPSLEHRVEPFEDDLVMKEPHYELLEEIEPIPINDEWLLKFPQAGQYPQQIQYVHELQNWYFWNHNKTDLVIND